MPHTVELWFAQLNNLHAYKIVDRSSLLIV